MSADRVAEVGAGPAAQRERPPAAVDGGRGVGPWLADHAVEIVFALLVLGAFAYSVRITRGSYFFSDEWLILHRDGSIGRMFDAYNDSLSVVTMALDRVLVEAFGLRYTPFRVVGLLALYLVPLAYFFTTRSRFGAVLAAILSLPLLWYGPFVSLMASEHNHNVALIGAVVAAGALNRGRRGDWVLAAGLTLSLCAAGGGVAVAAGCLVHNVCTRAHLRRWLAVVVPVAAWGVWWVVAVGHPKDLGPMKLSTAQTLAFVRRLPFTAFVSAGLDQTWLGYVLLAAFVVVGILALRRGLDAGANFVAWCVAVIVWSVGLATSRGTLADIHVFRYRYGALVFVLLAIVPRRPIRWPDRFPLATDRRYVVAGALLVLVLGLVRGAAVRTDLQSSGHELAAIGDRTRAAVLVAGLGPTVLPDGARAGTGIGASDSLTAGQVRRLLARYGSGPTPGPEEVDRRLARSALSTSRGAVRSAVGGPGCRPLSGVLTLPYQPSLARFGSQQIGGYVPVTLEADTPVEISVRRFGQAWVPVRTVGPGEAVTVAPSGLLQKLGASVPWQVRADGACRVGPVAP